MQIIVNGTLAVGSRELHHLDRVILAPNHMYVFIGSAAERNPSDTLPDYGIMQVEIAAAEVSTISKPQILMYLYPAWYERLGLIGRFGQGLDGILGGAAANLQNPEMRKIREDLVALLPMVKEANAISQELDKGIHFDLFVRSGAVHDLGAKEKKVSPLTL